MLLGWCLVSSDLVTKFFAVGERDDVDKLLMSVISDPYVEESIKEEAVYCSGAFNLWFSVDELLDSYELRKLRPHHNPRIFITNEVLFNMTLDQAKKLVEIFKRIDNREAFVSVCEWMEEVSPDFAKRLVSLWPVDVKKALKELDELDFELDPERGSGE